MTTPKADTRVLLVDDLTVDASQWETDLTAADAGAYEEEAARTAIDGAGEGRSIELVFEADTSSNGVLVDHGNAAAFQVGIGGGVVLCRQDTATIASATLPGVSGVLGMFKLQWSTEPNPGDGDELRSELTVLGPEGDVLRMVFDHGVPTASELDDFSVGGVWSGGSLTSDYGDAISVVRISARYHTSIEFREDFTTQTAEPDIDGWIVAELPRLPEQLLEQGEVAGPQYLIATAAGEQHRPRLAGPLVQALARKDWVTLGPDITEAYPPKWVVDLADGWQVPASWLWLLEVPRACGWLVVTLQIAMQSTNVDPPGQVEIRFTTSDARPGADGHESSRTVTHDADGEVILTFERCFVVRDQPGLTWAWLAMRITGDNAAATAYQIRQCTIVPESVPSLELPEEPSDIYSP